jgi:hypothetical protein
MGQLVFQATLGGQVNLVGPNTASTFNINVPAVAGNMVTTGDTGTVTNTMLAGSIANAKLTNSSVTIGSTSVALGATSTTLDGVTTLNGLTVGKGAGSVSTNTAVGASALAANTSGIYNTAIGYSALSANQTGGGNTAVGLQALRDTLNVANNTGIGSQALQANTTGAGNTGLGSNALITNTTGSNNTAQGVQALASNTTASNNTAVGYQAGLNNTTGDANVYIGRLAGFTGTTARLNTFVGDEAGGLITTGSSNTFIGNDSGYAVTTGSKNTIIGGYGGNSGGLDIRTASNYIVLSDGDGNPRGYYDGANTLWKLTGSQSSGAAAAIANDNATTPSCLALNLSAASPNNSSNYFLYCYDSSSTLRAKINTNGGLANYSANNSNLSDRREKTNFAPAKDYLATICAIPVQTYNYIDQDMENDGGLTLGVVAQDVQAVAPELVTESNWANEGDEPKMRLSIYQTDMQYALMKAIQELNAKVDAQAAEIAALKGQA